MGEIVFGSFCNGLVMKIGISLTSLLFPTLLLFGNSLENNLGVRLTAVVGLIGGIIALALMFKVKNPELSDEIHSNEIV